MRFVILAFTVFISAFLLFQIQPLIAKYILPWFGGTAGVWSVALSFFQIVLLAGYAYAHVLNTRAKPLVQAIVHCAVLGGAALLLPIIPPESLKPTGAEDPMLHILLLLLVTVGLPFFALSATGPLLQAWFGRMYPGRSPYALYALSNVGSLLALLSYPFLFEPLWGRTDQAVNWSIGFGVFAVLCASMGFLSLRSSAAAPAEPLPETAPEAELAAAEKEGASGAVGDNTKLPVLRWILLPACGTMLLIAFTNHICVDVASIPFLWVVPLSIYLLSFILTFAHARWYPRMTFLGLTMMGGIGAALLFAFHVDFGLWPALATACISLFVLTMVCHGEVYRLRPSVKSLTKFYMCISLGGAIGGVSVALLSPLLFPIHLEYLISVVLTVLLVLVCHAKDQQSLLFQGRLKAAWVLCALAILGTLGIGGYAVHRDTSDAIYISRNFYGVFRVEQTHPQSENESIARILFSGNTNHGFQLLSANWADRPTSYYGTNSGLGMTMDVTADDGGRRIAVLGLGTGSVAVYGQSNDFIRFYEINPESKYIAEEYFFYLRRTEAEIDIVLGDARLSLEREEPQAYDILILDVFTSDSIPVHVLTREAFDLYNRHLAHDGVIVVNVSNRHLDMRPVLLHSARAHGWGIAGWVSPGNLSQATTPAHWMIMTRDQTFMQKLGKFVESLRQVWPRGEGDTGVWPASFGMPLDVYGGPVTKPWTDDYANLFSILK